MYADALVVGVVSGSDDSCTNGCPMGRRRTVSAHALSTSDCHVREAIPFKPILTDVQKKWINKRKIKLIIFSLLLLRRASLWKISTRESPASSFAPIMGIVNSVELVLTLFTSSSSVLLLEKLRGGLIQLECSPREERNTRYREQEWLLQVGLVNELGSLETQKPHRAYWGNWGHKSFKQTNSFFLSRQHRLSNGTVSAVVPNSYTNGSVLFAENGAITQNNSAFAWDNTKLCWAIDSGNTTFPASAACSLKQLKD